MYCTNCGKKLEGSEIKCMHCQTSTNKKKNNTMKVKALVVVFIIVAVNVVGILFFRLHIDKQADNVMTYFAQSDYDKAVDLYNKYKGQSKSFEDKTLTNLKYTIEQIKEDFISEDMEYSLAQKQLKIIESFDIMGLDLIIYDTASWIDKINTSRENYLDAKAYYEQGEYEAALEKYGLVLKDDSKYYDLAVKEINLILLEEANKKEEELKKMTLSVPEFESNSFTFSYLEEDKEILFAEFSFPILIGETPAYESINLAFEHAKEYYMNQVRRMAEDARLNVHEEFFKPSGFGISYAVEYNNNGILCIVLNGYVYSGGAHGYPLQETYTFDLATGNRMKLSDLIADDKAFAQLVIDEFQRMYELAPDEYWENSLNLVKDMANNIDSLNYYISEDSICIYYFPYDLASYARGFVDIIISYKGNEGIFSFNIK